MLKLQFLVTISEDVIGALGSGAGYPSTPTKNSQQRMSKDTMIIFSGSSCICESQKSFICVLYRPPEWLLSNFRSCFDVIKQYIARFDDEYQLSLLGDVNPPIISWSNPSIFSGGLHVP